MADQNNPGQFGNREDTEEQARKGGQASNGSFGSENSADPSREGCTSEGGPAYGTMWGDHLRRDSGFARPLLEQRLK